MRSAQGVASKEYNQCSKADLSAAYKELFGSTPCANCEGVSWKEIYKSIIKQLNTLKQIPMSNAKYIWNPAHEAKTAFIKGRPVTAETADQKTLEILFNDPKREGLVIINPKWEEPEGKTTKPKKVAAPKVDEETKKDPCEDCDDDHPCEECEEKKVILALREKDQAISINKLHKETGIPKDRIKKYLE